VGEDLIHTYTSPEGGLLQKKTYIEMNNVLNNTLNLFPSTTTPQQTQTKLQKLVYNATSNSRGPTEIQRTISYSLYDDAIEYMNTLDMNRKVRVSTYSSCELCVSCDLSVIWLLCSAFILPLFD